MLAILFLRTLTPFYPSTYKIVFTVSTGVKVTLNMAAIREALRVLIDILKSFVKGLLLRTSSVSLLEKVSPNLEIGPCNNAME